MSRIRQEAMVTVDGGCSVSVEAQQTRGPSQFLWKQGWIWDRNGTCTLEWENAVAGPHQTGYVQPSWRGAFGANGKAAAPYPMMSR
jgi:hypothetical protein